MSQFYSLFRKNLFPVFYTVNTASIDKRKTSRFLEFCPLSGDMFFLHKKIKWTVPLKGAIAQSEENSALKGTGHYNGIF